MGKPVYLTSKELEWLETRLGNMTEMEAYWSSKFGDEHEKEMIDRLLEKVSN